MAAYDFNLGSQINISTDNMFTPISNPTFLYNPQRYQGGILQSTFRFEHNGYASGDKIYEFKVIDGSVGTTPAGLTIQKFKFNDNPCYGLQIAGTPYVLYYNNVVESIIKSTNKVQNKLVLTSKDNIHTLTGEFNGRIFSTTYNAVTKEVVDNVDTFEVEVVDNIDKSTQFRIKDMTNYVEHSFAIKVPAIMTSGSMSFMFRSFIDNVYTWSYDTIDIQLIKQNQTYSISWLDASYTEEVLKDKIKINSVLVQNNVVTFSFDQQIISDVRIPANAQSISTSIILPDPEERSKYIPLCTGIDPAFAAGTLKLSVDTTATDNTVGPNDDLYFEAALPTLSNIKTPATVVPLTLDSEHQLYTVTSYEEQEALSGYNVSMPIGGDVISGNDVLKIFTDFVRESLLVGINIEGSSLNWVDLTQPSKLYYNNGSQDIYIQPAFLSDAPALTAISIPILDNHVLPFLVTVRIGKNIYQYMLSFYLVRNEIVDKYHLLASTVNSNVSTPFDPTNTTEYIKACEIVRTHILDTLYYTLQQIEGEGEGEGEDEGEDEDEDKTYTLNELITQFGDDVSVEVSMPLESFGNIMDLAFPRQALTAETNCHKLQGTWQLIYDQDAFEKDISSSKTYAALDVRKTNTDFVFMPTQGWLVRGSNDGWVSVNKSDYDETLYFCLTMYCIGVTLSSSNVSLTLFGEPFFCGVPTFIDNMVRESNAAEYVTRGTPEESDIAAFSKQVALACNVCSFENCLPQVSYKKKNYKLSYDGNMYITPFQENAFKVEDLTPNYEDVKMSFKYIGLDSQVTFACTCIIEKELQCAGAYTSVLNNIRAYPTDPAYNVVLSCLPNYIYYGINFSVDTTKPSYDASDITQNYNSTLSSTFIVEAAAEYIERLVYALQTYNFIQVTTPSNYQYDIIYAYNHPFIDNVVPDEFINKSKRIDIGNVEIISAVPLHAEQRLSCVISDSLTLDFVYTVKEDTAQNTVEQKLTVKDSKSTTSYTYDYLNYNYENAEFITDFAGYRTVVQLVHTNSTNDFVVLDGNTSPVVKPWVETLCFKFINAVTYAFESTLPSVSTGYSIDKIKDNIATICASKDNTEINLNLNNFDVSGITSNGIQYTVDYVKVAILSGNEYQIDFTYVYNLKVDCILKGIVNCPNIVTACTDSQLIFTYNNVSYSADLSTLMQEATSTYLQVVSTDINTNKTKLLKTLNCANEQQVLQQQWDTTSETDNFWWVDKNHILRLDNFNFYLCKRKNEVDDWKADKWEELALYSRDTYLPNTVLKYGVTSAKDTSALYFTLTVIENDKLRLDIYDILNTFTKKSVVIKLNQKALGDKLNTDIYAINTYSPYNAALLLNSSVITSTHIGNYMLLGLHCDKNFNQWTVIIDLTASGSIVSVLQGYGFVGHDGLLTGGQIPSEYFNSIFGFNAIVEDVNNLIRKKQGTDDDDYIINDLKDLAFNEEAKRVVGTDKQQWYIDPNITDVVSHCRFVPEQGRVTTELLPLNNNYAYCYDSASFLLRILADNKGKFEAVTSLFDDNEVLSSDALSVWKTLWSIASYPFVLTFQPRLSSINYLQQSLGQYAYVHRNTSQNTIDVEYSVQDTDTDIAVYKSKDKTVTKNKTKISPLLDDTLSFDRQRIPQELKYSEEKKLWQKMPIFFLLGLVDAATSVLTETASSLLKGTIKDDYPQIGKQFSQNFLLNATNILTTDTRVNTLAPSLSSEVTAVKTLDMFYSNSSMQHVYAGPGFVNHNFVAQCVAQSVTSLQLEMNQIQFTYMFKELALFQLELVYAGEKFLVEAARADVIGMPSGGDVAYGIAMTAWVLLQIALLALKAHMAYMEAVVKLAPGILDGLGGGKLRTAIIAQASNHKYDIESKHTYGNKSEVFMFPCHVPEQIKVIDEHVKAKAFKKDWALDVQLAEDTNTAKLEYIDKEEPKFVTDRYGHTQCLEDWSDKQIPVYFAGCLGETKERYLPAQMACVIGTERILSPDWFKNENINEGEPVFATPVIQDYAIDTNWKLGMTATAGEIIWLSCGDTKLIDGSYSNIVINGDNFCGIATSYAAIELKHGINPDYIRPVNVTPNVLAINTTGYNVIYDDTMYHGFDGQGYRIVQWVGAAGMNKEFLTYQYNYISNDRFKRSNKLPPNQFLGSFKTDPVCNLTALGEDTVTSIITTPSADTGFSVGTAGEDKDVLRYAMPICFEPVSLLPASIKTLSSYELAVIDGVTSLCTDLRNTQSAYKTNESVDFNLQGELYRYADEWIGKVVNKNGVSYVEKLVVCLGLQFIGASPFEAYFYNYDTRQVYVYTGGTTLVKYALLERFGKITQSTYDFINQNILLTYDNNELLVLDDKTFARNMFTPITTIYNNESKFKVLSLPIGVVYQGPNRCIVNRAFYNDYMKDDVLRNVRKWKKTRERAALDYNLRDYGASFETVLNTVNSEIDGWTHNPFILHTAPVGLDQDTDALFEWTITFAWTPAMNTIYKSNMYACVNICADSWTPGGKLESKVTHVYLTKALFGKNNVGYYSFKFISGNGGCNRESLKIWCDSIIALSKISVDIKPITLKRTEILTQQVDIQNYTEM